VPKTEIRWLHLSDFHVGKDEYAQRELFDRIIEHVRRKIAEDITPHFVFVSGDLANRGKAQEYDTFNNDFLVPLQEAVGGKIASRTFTVPGNHDVDRSLNQPFDRKEILQPSARYFDPTAEGQSLREFLIPRFSAFAKKDTTIAHGVWISSTEGAFAHTENIDGIRVGIVCVSTAWLCKDDNDRERLTLGKGLLKSALEQINGCEVRIVIGHHPLDWMQPSERRMVSALLSQSSAIYLHGHLHEAWAEPAYGGGAGFLTVQCGAGFQSREGEAWKNGLLWGRLDTELNILALQPWTWSSAHQEWTLAPDAFPDSHRHVDWWIYRLPKADPIGPRPIRISPKSEIPSPVQNSAGGQVTLAASPRRAEGNPDLLQPYSRVVVVLHGIRTRGTWQKSLAPRLAREGFIPELLDYGWFSGLLFLIPSLRRRKIDWLRGELERIQAAYSNIAPSAIAHSFGSYLICRVMQIYAPMIRFDTVILCGSIVQRDFPWSKIFDEGLVRRVLNDQGKRDHWAGHVQEVVNDAGPSGKEGFLDNASGRVIELSHPEWGHSDFFFDTNFTKRWIPFLKGSVVKEVYLPPSTHVPRGLRFLVLAILIVILVMIFWPRKPIITREPSPATATTPAEASSTPTALTTLTNVVPAAIVGEIKLLVHRDKVAQARTTLKLTRAPDKRYQIYFVDTADLKLNGAGLILRLRDKGRDKTEITVKYRPENPSKPIDEKWLAKLAREPEWLVGKGSNLSYSLEQEIAGTELLEKPAENLAALFSDEQKAFVQHILKEEFDPAKLKVFGPIAAEIWEWDEPSVDDRVSAELWRDEQVFELSRKTKPDDLKKKAKEFEKAFKDKGIPVDSNPESKTRKALEYYSKPS
jgi:Calcineurin-like phosphoesterase